MTPPFDLLAFASMLAQGGFMRLIISFFVVVFLLAPAAFAADPPLVSVSTLQTGKYKARNSFVSGVSIQQWADSYLMKGVMNYAADAYPFDVLLNQDVSSGKQNLFSGEGTMSQGWTTGEVCTYRISIEVHAYSDRLFIRHYAPGEVYTTWSGSGCPPQAAQSTWGLDKAPFFLIPGGPARR